MSLALLRNENCNKQTPLFYISEVQKHVTRGLSIVKQGVLQLKGSTLKEITLINCKICKSTLYEIQSGSFIVRPSINKFIDAYTAPRSHETHRYLN